MSGMIGSGVAGAAMTVEWYTPKWVFDALGIDFDLDPCAPSPDRVSFVPCKNSYTATDDGLSKPWHGRVWLNPPYGKGIVHWTDRMIEHKNGIALIFSRTDAKWCQRVMRSADAMLFVSGRIRFIAGDGQQTSNSGAGSIFLAWGAENVAALHNMKDRGIFVVKSSNDDFLMG